MLPLTTTEKLHFKKLLDPLDPLQSLHTYNKDCYQKKKKVIIFWFLYVKWAVIFLCNLLNVVRMFLYNDLK